MPKDAELAAVVVDAAHRLDGTVNAQDLVVAADDFDDTAADFLKDREVLDDVEKALLLVFRSIEVKASPDRCLAAIKRDIQRLERGG